MSKQIVMYLYNGTLFSNDNESLKHKNIYEAENKYVEWNS